MAKIITDNQHYADIANAIRTKNETDTLYKPSEMAPAILTIQGGVELNFSVVGGKTAPVDPTENTIWVETDQEITGWVFSADEPAEPTDGMVWFLSGGLLNIEFNALKENEIKVCSSFSRQYVNGTWVEVPAKIYQNGAWVEWWSGKIYYNGNEYEELTGGWSTFAPSAQTFNNSACSKNDGKLTLKLTGSKCAVAWGTAKKVDLTNYSAIEFTIDTIYTEVGCVVSTMRNTESFVKKTASIIPKTAGIHHLDVSKLSGEYYIWFGDYTSNGAVYGAVISKIRLVK